MLTYRCTNILEVDDFSDSDYAGCMDDKKSTYGYIIMMVEGVVLWKSVNHTFTASSTMDAEYVVCYEATCHEIRLWNFILALEVVHSITRLLILFYDNFATISFSRNSRRTSCSKHVNVKYFFC